jgi:hypothetical protein
LKMMVSKMALGAAPFVVAAMFASGARAQIPYPTVGVENPAATSTTRMSRSCSPT